MQVAAALPSVESSLEDFISRANSTPDAGGWGLAVDSAVQEQRAVEIAQIEADADRRRQQDQARWKQVEAQLKAESEIRENALRKQLDSLQGKLAAAEARAAVAADTDGGAAANAAMAQLQQQVAKAEERVRTAEAAAKAAQAKNNEMAAEAATVKPAAAAPVAMYSGGDAELRAASEAAELRAKAADARATKALAIARAASAGLTVSPDDIEKIASSIAPGQELVAPASKTPWLVIGGAFLGGIAAMFGLTKMLAKDAPAATMLPAPAAAVAPAPAIVPAPPPVQPTGATVTPIPAPSITPLADEPTAVEPAVAEPAVVAAPVVPETPPVNAVAPVKAAEPKTRSKNRVKKTGIADPFASPAKAPAKKPKTGGSKPAIVDPF
ncbi:MAG: hypothetical protein KBG15_02990 [Kofleriaceae bacterium]|nr:hypothetical protein [Kofleriaceae bacterium]